LTQRLGLTEREAHRAPSCAKL